MSTLETVNIWTAPDDDTGDTIRDWWEKINDNFAALNADKQEILAEWAFVNWDKTKLDWIEAWAKAWDVTAASNLWDNLLIRWDWATKWVQNSLIAIDDDNNISNVNGVEMDIAPTSVTDAEWVVSWNATDKTLDINTWEWPVLQVGQEIHVRVHNATWGQLDNWTVVYPVWQVWGLPSVEKAIASDVNTLKRPLYVLTADIADWTNWVGSRFGYVRWLDTSLLTLWSEVYLSPTVAWALVSTRPQFPDYVFRIGWLTTKDAVSGAIFVALCWQIEDTFQNGWDWVIRETFDFRVASNWTVITGTLSNPNVSNDDLTLIFSTGFHVFDTSVLWDVILTAWADDNPQTNYVYIPEDTKVLTVSTSGHPVTEHCRIADVNVQSASNVQSVGWTRGNQNINDHIKTDEDNWHIPHMAAWIRKQFATWEEWGGVESTITASVWNWYVEVTSGVVSQLHDQDVDAISMPTRDILIANDPDTTWRETDNLNTITKFSDGSAWSNKWGKVVVWLIANKTWETDFIALNLPRSWENDEAKALLDEKNRANYNIPAEYKSKAILLGAFAININAGAVTYNWASTGYQNLRWTIPSNVSGWWAGWVTTLLALDDIDPSSYSWQVGKILQVNAWEVGMEFTDAPTISNTNITETTDKNYVTDAEVTVIWNTSWTNSWDQTTISWNAWTATALETARTINNVSFDWSANIILTPSINAQTGTTYTFVLTDQSKLVTLTNASAITATVPPNSSVAFPIWTQIDASWDGAWKVTFAEWAWVTINSEWWNKALAAQWVWGTLIKKATDTWTLYGNLIA